MRHNIWHYTLCESISHIDELTWPKLKILCEIRSRYRAMSMKNNNKIIICPCMRTTCIEGNALYEGKSICVFSSKRFVCLMYHITCNISHNRIFYKGLWTRPGNLRWWLIKRVFNLFYEVEIYYLSGSFLSFLRVRG